MPCDIEAARSRVGAAIERMGYRLLGENPMQAKRKAVGWGIFSNTIFEYRISPVQHGSRDTA
jgi:hypothetical protein